MKDIKYDLQFFAEKGEEDDIDTTNTDVGDTDNSGVVSDEVNTEAFAELISDRDKKIEQLEAEMNALKKANANLLVKISAGEKTEQNFEESLLSLVGYKPRKE